MSERRRGCRTRCGSRSSGNQFGITVVMSGHPTAVDIFDDQRVVGDANDIPPGPADSEDLGLLNDVFDGG